jgi:predicted transcriptional regulator
MDHLTKKGAVGIYKDDNLLVHFTTLKENELSDEIILKIIDEIGYEPKNFKITRIYE